MKSYETKTGITLDLGDDSMKSSILALFDEKENKISLSPTTKQKYIRYNCWFKGYYLTLTVFENKHWNFSGCTGWTRLNRISGKNIDELIPYISRLDYSGDSEQDEIQQNNYRGLVESSNIFPTTFRHV